ncbi:MAG: helix-turn-helix transcriptional regulator [Thermomicrobiales bacterium]
MDHPTTRVLATLEMLQARPRLSGKDLAERLEVDPRTVRRYITILQDLGVPVEAERGRYGAYRLRPGSKLPPLMFSDDEALALTLGLLVVRRLGLASAALAVERALAKVERVLPPAVREGVGAVLSTVALDLPPGKEPPPGEILVALSAAASQGRRTWLRYRSAAGQETAREVDPYGIVFYWSRWFLTGYCHLRHDLRTFRLDRILETSPRDETFTRPEGFDALSHVQASLATAPAAWEIVALLHLPFEEARRRVPPTMAALEPAPEGTIFRASVEDLGTAARGLLWLDCEITIRAPAALRDELRRLAARATALAERGTEDHGA